MRLLDTLFPAVCFHKLMRVINIAIFHFFHWQPSALFLQRLSQEQARQANYQSNHHYSLEKYGLQKAEINAKLRAVFAKYQWPIEQSNNNKASLGSAN